AGPGAAAAIGATPARGYQRGGTSRENPDQGLATILQLPGDPFQILLQATIVIMRLGLPVVGHGGDFGRVLPALAHSCHFQMRSTKSRLFKSSAALGHHRDLPGSGAVANVGLASPGQPRRALWPAVVHA